MTLPRSFFLPLWGCILVLTLTAVVTPAARAYVNPMTGDGTIRGVTRGFSPPPQPWLPGHRGVDLAGNPGSPVFAADDGIVAFAGVVAGTPIISIDHTDGIRTTYQPITAFFSAGTAVVRGQTIGTLSVDNNHSGALHWGARPGGKEDVYIDPLSLLDTPVIRLKPARALS